MKLLVSDLIRDMYLQIGRYMDSEETASPRLAALAPLCARCVNETRKQHRKSCPMYRTRNRTRCPYELSMLYARISE